MQNLFPVFGRGRKTKHGTILLPNALLKARTEARLHRGRRCSTSCSAPELHICSVARPAAGTIDKAAVTPLFDAQLHAGAMQSGLLTSDTIQHASTEENIKILCFLGTRAVSHCAWLHFFMINMELLSWCELILYVTRSLVRKQTIIAGLSALSVFLN